MPNITSPVRSSQYPLRTPLELRNGPQLIAWGPGKKPFQNIRPYDQKDGQETSVVGATQYDLEHGIFALPDGVDALLRLAGAKVTLEYANTFTLHYQHPESGKWYVCQYRIESSEGLEGWGKCLGHLAKWADQQAAVLSSGNDAPAPQGKDP